MAILEKADIVGVFGGSGTGKTYLVMNLIKKERRLLVWDSMAQYKGKIIDGDFKALMKAVQSKQFRIAFRPDFENLSRDFARFCRLSYAVGNMRLVVEELNELTKPSYAPPCWKNINSRGRHRGLRLIGLSQRPASVDKDFIANATEIYSGRLPYPPDWKSLASKFGKDAAKIENLPNHTQMHYVAGG